MVQRRNLHIHKNGVVDERYFSKGNGRSFCINIGDYAIIDKTYYINAFKCLMQLVDNIDSSVS